MIPTEEPKHWPWHIRIAFVIIGMIAWPFIAVINFVKYLKKEMGMKNIKLETALIEVGKEVEKLKNTPTQDDLYNACICFNQSISDQDMKAIRKYGKRLNALITKYMVDNL